jgi:4-alpha-glucanotransferase
MESKFRSSGIALPIFSLPSNYGIGTIGEGARKFIDFLSASGFSYWSILPLVPTSFLDSPYQSFASKALNPYFIDLDDLIEKNLLKKKDLSNIDWGDSPRRIDYGKIYQNRLAVLKIAYKRFLKGKGDYQRGYTLFLRRQAFQDYACFQSLKEANSDKAWSDYLPPDNEYSSLRFRGVKHRHKEEVEFQIWTQYIFLRQWKALRDYATEKGVAIIGEMPMYVSYDSIDVYKHHRNFLLNAANKMEEVTGYPPDVFHATGQVWGNPLYNYDYLRRNNYRFVKERLDFNLRLYDKVILSHFREIMESYALPKDATDGMKGTWRPGPGKELIQALGVDPKRIVAEDVDFHSNTLDSLLNDFSLSDMRVVEFGFPREQGNFNQPINCPYSCCSFSTTHDCKPLLGYFQDLSGSECQEAIAQLNINCRHLGVQKTDGTPKDMVRAVLELNLASVSAIAIQAMADILGQGNESRINEPSVSGNNWVYRITEEDLSPELATTLKETNRRYAR